MDQAKIEYCCGCAIKFKPAATRYYCCDPYEVFCLRCRNTLCKKCKKTKFRQVTLVTCNVCKGPQYEQLSFYDYKQEKKICLECIRIAYSKCILADDKKVAVVERYLVFIEYDIEEIEAYFKQFCWECCKFLPHQNQEKFMEVKQLSLLLCKDCYEKSQKEQKALLKQKARKVKVVVPPPSSYQSFNRQTCNACGRGIYNHAGFVTEDFVICQNCVRLSSIAEENAWNSNTKIGGKENHHQNNMRPRKRSEDMMEERRQQDMMQPIQNQEKHLYTNKDTNHYQQYELSTCSNCAVQIKKEELIPFEEFKICKKCYIKIEKYQKEDPEQKMNQEFKITSCHDCGNPKGIFQIDSKVLCANCRFSS